MILCAVLTFSWLDGPWEKLGMNNQSPFLAGNAEQRRHSARHKMFGPVTLCVANAEMRGHFLDLSTSGALVVWARGKRFGIQFSQPMTDEAIDTVIRGS